MVKKAYEIYNKYSHSLYFNFDINFDFSKKNKGEKELRL